MQKAISTEEAEITLINKEMNITMKQHGYMEASAGTLNYEDVLYPVESVLKKDKVNFVQAEVTKIDRDAKR